MRADSEQRDKVEPITDETGEEALSPLLLYGTKNSVKIDKW